MDALSGWLRDLGLEHFEPVFAENGVDLDALPLINESELEKLGLRLGHRKKLLKAIAGLNGRDGSTVTVLPDHAALSAQSSPSVDAERRQLTVLFCDLVGSTELSRQLDPEDYRKLVRSYQATCAQVIAGHEGHIAQHLGDGLLVYFGYPKAHEDSVQHAVYAALAIVAGVSDLRGPTGPLCVRVGIHTGVVVIGEIGTGATQEQLALGDTPNFAARLQCLASPGAIVLSDSTRRLAAGSFEYRDLGLHSLKGIGAPVRAWQALAASTVDTRFEAAHGSRLTPMVGRELELTVLMHAWRQAHSSKGGVVLLCGEPGIGKSRILRGLREKLGLEGIPACQYQCSPYFTNTALYPVVDHFERVLGFGRNDSPELKLDRVQSELEGYGRPVLDASLIGRMLSLPAETRHGALGMTPQKQKTETIRALVDAIEARARKQPVLMLFEDLHWADPTTLEFLETLLARVGQIPLLLVVTCRPEFGSQWIGRPGVTALTLSRLDREQTRAIAARVARGKELPEEILEQIVAKTDGIPLFVEELTKAILESGLVKPGDSGYELSAPLATLTIPTTLRDSLMARLDRLALVKDVAQIAACIGREFQPELLALISPQDPLLLQQSLEQLLASELVYTRGQAPNLLYVFKHALIQEAAYDSLLKARRVQVHAQIAVALEQHFPQTKVAEPELLAFHYNAAGLTNEAIDYWLKAGELGLQRVALNEAIAHLDKGVQALGTLPVSVTRDARELALRTLLGTAWMMLRGWAAPEVEANFGPALKLAKALNHQPNYLAVAHGLYAYDVVRGRIAESFKWVKEMQETAEALDDPVLRIAAHRMAITSNLWNGHLQEVRRHGDSVVALYDADQGRRIETLTNHDPLTLRGVWGTACLWLLGYPEQALRLRQEADAHARARAPFGLCVMLTHGSWIFSLRGEPEQAFAQLDEAERLGRTHSMPVFSEVLVPLWRTVVSVDAGGGVEDIARLRLAMDKWGVLGCQLGVPYFKAVLALGVARSGDVAGGLVLIDECLAQIERPDLEERVSLPEVLRRKGWMLGQQGRPDEAQRTLHQALAIAREQEAKSWELRIASTLAELLMERDAQAEARDVLAPIYGWFTEGFDTRDLQCARGLLERLS